MKHTVEIPESFLLTIAICGKMGSGELPALIQAWAAKECERLGLKDVLKELQEKAIIELGQRMQKVLGKDVTDKLNNILSQTMQKVTR